MNLTTRPTTNKPTPTPIKTQNSGRKAPVQTVEEVMISEGVGIVINDNIFILLSMNKSTFSGGAEYAFGSCQKHF